MFEDSTNFFYSHHQMKTLFETVNCELKNVSQWFRANKLPLNIYIYIKNKVSIISSMFYQRRNFFKTANIENRKQSNRKNTIHKSLRSDVE